MRKNEVRLALEIIEILKAGPIDNPIMPAAEPLRVENGYLFNKEQADFLKPFLELQIEIRIGCMTDKIPGGCEANSYMTGGIVKYVFINIPHADIIQSYLEMTVFYRHRVKYSDVIKNTVLDKEKEEEISND